jgi:hypothetical protein
LRVFLLCTYLWALPGVGAIAMFWRGQPKVI